MNLNIPVLNSVTAKAAMGADKGASMLKIPHAEGMKFQNANGLIDTSSQGYQYAIQTTTFIHAKVISQVFYELDGRKISDYIPVEMGVAPWMENYRTNLTYMHASDDFEAATQSMASGPTRRASTSVGVAPRTATAYYFMSDFNYNTFELNKAVAANNWNLVESLTQANKKFFDLGLQKVAFLGRKSDLTLCPGLLSQSEVTVNTNTLLTGALKDLSYSDFNTFMGAVVSAYRDNANQTAMPNRMVIPMSDFVGLGDFVNPEFPVLTRLVALENMFKAVCGQDFQILPLAYADAANNAGYWAVSGTNRYCLYRHEPECIKMDVPLAYTLNAPGTADNFTWTTVSYAQYTGAIVYRIPHMFYIDWHI